MNIDTFRNNWANEIGIRFTDRKQATCGLYRITHETDYLSLGVAGEVFMWLGREHVTALLPYLQYFAEHGKLPEEVL